MYVCMYPSRLGMLLFRATRANVGITCARVTPRNVTGSSPPDLNTTLHEIDSQVCTALCITALSDCALYHCAVGRPPTSTGSAARSELEEDAS